LSFTVIDHQQREQNQPTIEEVDLTSEDEEVVETLSLLDNDEDEEIPDEIKQYIVLNHSHHDYHHHLLL